MKPYNFFAGPAILPEQVLKKAQESIGNFAEMNLSLIEISHRSKQFVAVMDEAEALVRELLHIGDDYAVLFLSGGASSQFYMSAMNIMQEKAAYLDTGTWSSKAIKEAKLFGTVDLVASSKDKNYSYIPKDYTVSSDNEYFHITSNNTIYGTQIHAFPEVDMPLVCDASSDMFSRPLDMSKFGLIYAGAQKNVGAAGTTLVIIRKDMLGKVNRVIPTMLKYETHIEKKSMFNTPPVFSIYVCMLVFRWLKDLGGLDAIQNHNVKKAETLYKAIDDSDLFYGTVAKEDRSLMNICFKLKEESLNDAFLEMAEKHACVGLKGHRSVGGFRASTYNAMSQEGANTLADVIKAFDAKYA